MVIKDTFSIMSARFNVVVKFFVAIAIISLLTVVISSAALTSNLKDVYIDLNALNLPEQLKEIREISIQDSEAGRTLIQMNVANINNVLHMHREKILSSLATLISIVVVLILLYNVLHFALSKMYNDFMSASVKYKFRSALLTTINKSLPYALFKTVLVIPSIAAEMALLFYIGKGLLYGGSLLFLTAIGWVFIILEILRHFIFSQWTPFVINERENIFKSLFNSIKFSFKHAHIIMGYFFIYITCALAITRVFGRYSYGIGYVLGSVVAAISYKILPLVLYFRLNSFNYYVKEGVIRKIETVEDVF